MQHAASLRARTQREESGLRGERTDDAVRATFTDTSSTRNGPQMTSQQLLRPPTEYAFVDEKNACGNLVCGRAEDGVARWTLPPADLVERGSTWPVSRVPPRRRSTAEAIVARRATWPSPVDPTEGSFPPRLAGTTLVKAGRHKCIATAWMIRGRAGCIALGGQ